MNVCLPVRKCPRDRKFIILASVVPSILLSYLQFMKCIISVGYVLKSGKWQEYLLVPSRFKLTIAMATSCSDDAFYDLIANSILGVMILSIAVKIAIKILSATVSTSMPILLATLSGKVLPKVWTSTVFSLVTTILSSFLAVKFWSASLYRLQHFSYHFSLRGQY